MNGQTLCAGGCGRVVEDRAGYTMAPLTHRYNGTRFEIWCERCERARLKAKSA